MTGIKLFPEIQGSQILEIDLEISSHNQIETQNQANHIEREAQIARIQLSAGNVKIFNAITSQ